MKLKYVNVENYGMIIFPDTDQIWHRHIGNLAAQITRNKIISAGFIEIAGSDFYCYGESESLKIQSKPKEDTECLRKMLGF